jgi:hypothetical protein
MILCEPTSRRRDQINELAGVVSSDGLGPIVRGGRRSSSCGVEANESWLAGRATFCWLFARVQAR